MSGCVKDSWLVTSAPAAAVSSCSRWHNRWVVPQWAREGPGTEGKGHLRVIRKMVPPSWTPWKGLQALTESSDRPLRMAGSERAGKTAPGSWPTGCGGWQRRRFSAGLPGSDISTWQLKEAWIKPTKAKTQGGWKHRWPWPFVLGRVKGSLVPTLSKRAKRMKSRCGRKKNLLNKQKQGKNRVYCHYTTCKI